MTDPYVLPNGVLRNLLHITTASALEAAEADITRARLLQIAARPLPGSFDLAHLCAMHAFVFGDLYDWAGRTRTVNIAKHTPFCPAHNIVAYSEDIFGRLRAADWLRGLTRPAFVVAAAGLYADLNSLHPFREGNGRTQRVFLTQLSHQAGRPISWASMDCDENIAASIKSYHGDNEPLERMLDRFTAGE